MGAGAAGVSAVAHLDLSGLKVVRVGSRRNVRVVVHDETDTRGSVGDQH